MPPLNQVCQDVQIRQQEIGARKQIAKNPVQMESIKAEVGFNAAVAHVLMVLPALLVVHASAGQMLLPPLALSEGQGPRPGWWPPPAG